MTSLFPSIIKFLRSVALLPVHTVDVHLILFHPPQQQKKKVGTAKSSGVEKLPKQDNPSQQTWRLNLVLS